MSPPTILLVEDNPTTRKMLRAVLEAEGLAVIEAPNGQSALDRAAEGAPDLILQDLVLPDFDGFELVGRLRALPGLAGVPILALSGFPAGRDDIRASAAGFADFLTKPVERTQLVQAVRANLADEGVPVEERARRPLVLLADDDPVQQKLLGARLWQRGFKVTTADDGAQALEEARRSPPDAIVSDVQMPNLDGFQLCLAVRQDPLLGNLPVILTTARYLEEPDRRLAERVGASAFVPRTPGHEQVIEALANCLRERTAPRPADRPETLESEHAHRVLRQLERQAAMNTRLAQRCALLGTELTILSRVAEVLARHESLEPALDEVLISCLDAGGISLGALYLLGPGVGLRVRPYGGYTAADLGSLETFFGHERLLREIVERGAPATIPSPDVPDPAGREILQRAALKSLIAIPLVSHGERLGALLLASRGKDLAREEAPLFARTLGVQLGQAVALARSFERLAASEQRYRGLFEHARDAVLVLDRAGVILEANRQAETMLGLARGETVGRPYLTLVDPADRDAVAAQLERLAVEGSIRCGVSRLRRADGETVFVECSAAGVPLDGDRVVIGIVRDVTERRRTEEALRSKEDQLRQAQKMEAVGRLAGGVAHDFNNLLTAVIGFGDLALGGLGEGDPLRRDLEEIKKAATRAAALTRQLLAFSRKQVLAPVVLDLNGVVANMDRLLRRLIGEDVELATTLDPALGAVKADAGQIEQVIMNLAVNARDAMSGGGKLTIETSNAELDEAYAARHADVRAGPHVLLAVRDTGCGMDAATRARLFEPFFTTKELGKGTGLGLSTVYGIVRQSGGHISVRSEPGRGATFEVYLPRVAEEPAERPAGGAPRERAPTGTETVLLVEDEEVVRELASRILKRCGYNVIGARHGGEVLVICERHRGPIHLLLTDIVLPHLSGRELAERLAPSHPGLRVLYMSGYAGGGAAQLGELAPGVAFIDKPFTPEGLARKVREVLDAPRTDPGTAGREPTA